ncbi:response regulator [Limisalsivibrio acetivorans]|uniref:response regulator n=1 Tax=Limisalsivibrio acetivorans TaxID=1304888 RepID=UPI0003B3DF59|nr:response regulator [Limisalsivibrio acetivorans]
MKGRSVLIIDSDPGFLSILQNELALLGLRADGAETPEDGLTMVRDMHESGKRYDLVVMEHKLAERGVFRKVKGSELVLPRMIISTGADKIMYSYLLKNDRDNIQGAYKPRLLVERIKNSIFYDPSIATA